MKIDLPMKNLAHNLSVLILVVSSFLTGCSAGSEQTDEQKNNSIVKGDPMKVQLPIVKGNIKEIQLTEIPNKAIGKASRYETWITLDVKEVINSKGEVDDPSLYENPIFAGDSSLVNSFDLNEMVKIVCSSITGRHIQTIERIN
ncbi:MAG: hypothetical protein AB8B56_19210 [Crocinitomicaceae bacterium]